MSFLPLKDLLPKAIRTARISDQVQAAQTLAVCQLVLASAVPPAVAKCTQPLSVRHGVLTLRVASPAVAQELHWREADILRQLKARSPLPIERLSYRPAEFR